MKQMNQNLESKPSIYENKNLKQIKQPKKKKKTGFYNHTIKKQDAIGLFLQTKDKK